MQQLAAFFFISFSRVFSFTAAAVEALSDTLKPLTWFLLLLRRGSSFGLNNSRESQSANSMKEHMDLQFTLKPLGDDGFIFILFQGV